MQERVPRTPVRQAVLNRKALENDKGIRIYLGIVLKAYILKKIQVRLHVTDTENNSDLL